MMVSVRRYTVLVLLAPVLLFYSCDRPASPPGYNLLKPQKSILNSVLDEVSGIYYLPTDRKFIAITDEKGTLFEMDTTGSNIRSRLPRDFAGKDDYEDLVMVDSLYYVLVSNGSIIEINSAGGAVAFKFHGNKKDDFETMYFEPATASLITLCKECNHEKKSKARTAYRFDLKKKQFDPQPYYTIPVKQVSDMLKDGIAQFNPSAAAIHPIEKDLFILSSAGTLLTVADLKGKVKGVYRLNPVMYPQAEGIAFAPNGDMFITNEAKLGKAILLKLPYKPKAVNKK